MQLKKEVDEYLCNAVCVPQCLALCEEMQKKVPRELRDMIYGHVLYTSKIHIAEADLDHESRAETRPTETVEGVTAFPRRAPISFSQDFLEHFRRRDYAHIVNDGYADTLTRVEFLEAWYRTTTFCVNDAKTMSDLLASDHWGTSLNVRSLVRSVELSLWSMPVPLFECCSTVNEAFRDYGPQTLLQAASQLRKGTKLTITVRHACSCLRTRWSLLMSLEEGVSNLADLFPRIEALVKASDKVGVMILDVVEFDVKGIEELTVEYWTKNARLLFDAGLAS